jgi:hypothetical protein
MNLTEAPREHIEKTKEITIEQFLKRKVQRRRRVAKRLIKRVPLFAVEEMQNEFPGYEYEEFIADVTRKTRKGKSFRRTKTKGFDWKQLYREVPAFVSRCMVRTKTKAVIRGKTGSGLEFICVIRSVYFSDQGQLLFFTHDLIRLLKGSLQELHKHPAVNIYRYNETFFEQ